MLMNGIRFGIHNGILLPLAVRAAIQSKAVRWWLLPFAGPYVLLALLVKEGINVWSHIFFPANVYAALFGAVGLAGLKNQWRKSYYFLSGMVLLIILPPFAAQIAYRWHTGWAGLLTQEQAAAGKFIREVTPENAVFVVFPDSRYAITCVEGLGERRLVFGWFFHLNRYERQERLYQRAEEVVRFYSGEDSRLLTRFTTTYGADYIFFRAGREKVSGKAGPGSRKV